MYTTTVRIPDELAEAVKVYCARTGASVNGALLVALERLVEEAAWAKMNQSLDGTRLVGNAIATLATPPASAFRPDPKPGKKP